MNKEEINNEFIKRIELLMNYKSLNQRSLSKEIGFSYSTLNKYCNKKSNTIDFELIYRLASHFCDINIDWLICGKGEMLIAEEQPSEAGNERLGKLIDTIALLQETVNNYKKRLGDLEARNKRLEAELAMFKNERLIG
jgi:transcriptional regulator with XRE-family HTH domain